MFRPLSILMMLSFSMTQHLHAQQRSSGGNLVARELPGNTQEILQAMEVTESNQVIAMRPFLKNAVSNALQKKDWPVYLESAFQLSMTYAGNEGYEEGVALARQALDTIRSLGPSYRKANLPFYHALMNIYLLADRDEDLLRVNHEGLAVLQKSFKSEENPYFARTYANLGLAYEKNQDFDQAMIYYQKAEGILDTIGTKDAEGVAANIYQGLGGLNANQGKVDLAIRQYELAVDYATVYHGANHPELLTSYYKLARLYYLISEPERCIEYYRKGVYLIDQSNTDNPRWLYYLRPTFYSGIAEAYIDLEEYEEALQWLNQAVKLTEGRDDPWTQNLTVQMHLHLAQANTGAGNEDLALEHLAALDPFLSLSIVDQGEVAFQDLVRDYQLVMYANLYRKRGDWGIAEAYLRKSLLVTEARNEEPFLKGDNHMNVLGGLAEVLGKQGRLDSALHFNQLALIAGCREFDSQDVFDLPYPEDFGDWVTVYHTLSEKANLLRLMATQQENRQLEEEYFETAYRTIGLADAVHQRNLEKLNLLRGGKTRSLLQHVFTPYGSGLALAYERFQKTGSEEDVAQGFYYTQRMKAQRLWLSILKSEAADFGNLDRAMLEEEQNLRTEITYYESQVMEARQAGDTATMKKLQNDNLFYLKEELVALQRTLEENYPDYYEAKYAFRPETGESLRQVLNGDELVVEYIFTDSALYAFTMATDRPMEFRAIVIDDETVEQVEALQKMLQNSPMRRRSSRERFISLSHQLYKQFVEPIEDQLAGKERLLIIGDGMINYIPFDVLLTSAQVKPFTGLDFLIRKYDISYHYSASLLANARRKDVSGHSGIYAFAPVYEPADGEPLTVGNGDRSAERTTFRAMDPNGGFAHLPESEQEVKNILQLFGEAGINPKTLVLRQDATESSLKQNLGEPYRYIHIAAHSFADLDQPRFSGIACYEEEEAVTEDGILHTGEIYNITTQADLVTLSSCESGYGKLERTEGLLGLNRAFIYAGTPNVVFSLWKVYDKVNASLMTDFYRGVLEGQGYSRSLRAAKLKLLEKDETAAPHFWSPYLLIGR